MSSGGSVIYGKRGQFQSEPTRVDFQKLLLDGRHCHKVKGKVVDMINPISNMRTLLHHIKVLEVA